jgi:hypothetical protein
MLEILLIWFMTKKVGEIVENKGYGSVFIKIGLVVAYLFGAIFGGALGAVVSGPPAPGQSMPFLHLYAFAFAGALLCCGFVFMIAILLPEQRSDRGYMDDYFRNRRRRGSGEHIQRKRRDDDRYAPRRDDYHDDRDRPRRRDDDDDDDRPRRRRDNDYDDDDRPRRRREEDDRPRRRDNDDRVRRRRDDDDY